MHCSLFDHETEYIFFSGENKPKNYLQLAGRILVVFMFATLLRLEISFMQVINCHISPSDKTVHI
jgi:SURF4 family